MIDIDKANLLDSPTNELSTAKFPTAKVNDVFLASTLNIAPVGCKPRFGNSRAAKVDAVATFVDVYPTVPHDAVSADFPSAVNADLFAAIVADSRSPDTRL